MWGVGSWRDIGVYQAGLFDKTKSQDILASAASILTVFFRFVSFEVPNFMKL